jgi:ribonuclease D
MTIITSNDKLQLLCHSLLDKKFITVDTEFLRTDTYYPRLCLLQIADNSNSYLIDPLSGLDLAPLFKIFQNEQILKVFHAAKQDIEIILKLSGKVPYPIFDTQVAATFTNHGEAISYEQLVIKLCGIQLDKNQRFTDWSKRPLTKEQLEYARNDVIFLKEVYFSLVEILKQQNRTAWMEEEMSALLNPENYQLLPENAWLKLKISSQDFAFLSLIRKIAEWREYNAQTLNVPRNHLLKEEIIYELIRQRPTSIVEVKKLLRGNPKADKEEFLRELLAILTSSHDSFQLEVSGKGDWREKKKNPLLAALKLLLKLKSNEHQVPASVIASVAELAMLAETTDQNKIQNSRLMRGWRLEIFGQYAWALKEGKFIITGEGDEAKLLPVSY